MIAAEVVSIDLHAAPFPIPEDHTVVERTRRLISLLYAGHRPGEWKLRRRRASIFLLRLQHMMLQVQPHQGVLLS